MNITTHDALLKDLYPLPGTRLKQWVVDARREAAWELETCPQVEMPEHEDNTGAICRNFGKVPWTFIDTHDCCERCNSDARLANYGEKTQAWLAERAARPPICSDRDKLSDEIEADWPEMREHPFMKLVVRR